jgi:chromosome segregation protein
VYLSKIEILGFKSFAQRVDLKYDSGVTAIVGPNGCGKTNIVDAIRWVLGEQRYGALRSEKMEDLIFNGTKNRKPLSMAEVSIIIQNTKGILPTEYSEVTITRRVYRSGESEYLLNRVPCRLKDILDLFMDTGIGADAYSVIELKMVETILSDKADERRRLFEEAAGVTKYKHRRKAAYRKLENVQQDLVRVNDIVKEIQKTVNSLERQAKKAEQYNEVSHRLRTIEVDLLEREFAYVHSRLQEVDEKLRKAMERKQSIDSQLTSQESRLDELRQVMSATEGALIVVQREAAAQVEKIHNIEEQNLVATERRRSLHDAIERCEREKVDLRIQQEKLQNDVLMLNERKQSLEGEVEVVQQEYDHKKRALQEFEAFLSQRKTDLQIASEENIALIHAISEKRSVEGKLKSRIDGIKGRIERTTEENSRYSLELGQMEERVQRMTTEDRDLRRRFVEAEMQLYQEESRKTQLQEETESLQHKSVALKMEIERKRARIDFLKGLVEGVEGSSEGAKYLLTNERWKKRNFVTVADVVSAQEKYRIAIESALGDAANLLVVEQEADAHAAIDELRKNGMGKATFVLLSRIPHIRRKHRRPRPSLILAVEVAETKPTYRSLINLLLQDVVIAETLEHAKSIARSTVGARVVTLDGQVVTSSGIVRGGSLRHGEGGFIGKKNQIAEFEQDIQRLQQELDEIKAKQAEKTRINESLELKPYREAVKTIEKEMTAIEIGIAQIEFEKKRAHEVIDRNNAEVDQLRYEIAEAEKTLEAASADIRVLEQSRVNADRRVTAVGAEVEALEEEWSGKAKGVNDIELELVSKQSDKRNFDRELEYTTTSLREVGALLLRRDEEIVQARGEISQFSSQLESHESTMSGLREAMRAIDQRKRVIEQEYAGQREEIHRVELALKDERRLHDEAMEAVHELELRVAELRSNVDHLKERALKEFELELELKTYAEDEWVDFAARREEVQQLKEKIRALGAINFAAFDEFKTEGERLHFLTQQRDDLLEAERTLLSTIEEINNTAQKKFLDTFALIRENFIKTFRGLFDPGDECDLRLEENVDPLEAKIEIIAKPRGKRPTSIELLSGGEKTLTAIALLFAIYLVKPSPFCILDEVDAPLDDSNVDRYTRILHKFSDNTQFIVVTHNKRTMEAANALYGVTMEEEGVSKIVSVRFTEGARVESAAIASGI